MAENGGRLRVGIDIGGTFTDLLAFNEETGRFTIGKTLTTPDDPGIARPWCVFYLLHGLSDDHTIWMRRTSIERYVAGLPLVVVMPDGGQAGWYSNPVGSFVGPRNWETFHMAQLIPWIEANFRTYAEYDGRAVGGFSMGGFGALKYAAKYYGHFASVSSHSGPASLRRDGGLVVHWANLSSAVVELGGATVYGVPWDEARVSADNPVERIDSYRNKRIFLVAGTSPDPINWFDSVQETQVLAGQREFRKCQFTSGNQTATIWAGRYRDPSSAYEVYTSLLRPTMSPSTVGRFTAVDDKG